jgi:hypothetical protein
MRSWNGLRRTSRRSPHADRRAVRNIGTGVGATIIHELAKHGDAVFLGRGGHLLLRDFLCALHVRVTASPETCIRNLMAQGLTREAATRTLKRSDDDRRAFITHAVGVDWEDPTR